MIEDGCFPPLERVGYQRDGAPVYAEADTALDVLWTEQACRYRLVREPATGEVREQYAAYYDVGVLARWVPGDDRAVVRARGAHIFEDLQHEVAETASALRRHMRLLMAQQNAL